MQVGDYLNYGNSTKSVFENYGCMVCGAEKWIKEGLQEGKVGSEEMKRERDGRNHLVADLRRQAKGVLCSERQILPFD